MATMNRARAISKVNRKNTVSVTGRANAVCNGIDANPTLFPSPTVPTSAIKAQVAVLNTAEIGAAARTKGAAAARDVQRNILIGMIEADCTYVQGIADKSATVDQAVATIQAGGYVVAEVSGHLKSVLTLSQGPSSGSADLAANASVLTGGSKAKHCFNWAYSGDGKNWVTMPSTPKSKTTVSGLTPMTTYAFRVSVTGPSGIPGEWSQVVSFLVR